MADLPAPLSNTAVDQLGDRLRSALTVEDLHLLDQYRREFQPSYQTVVVGIRNTLALEVTGRPGKSNAAIVDKLKRGTIRLSKMQDIAGCRIIVADTGAQDSLVERLSALFESEIFDRRAKPSHGYRAVRVVARPNKRPIEIQVRTVLQQRWAEMSEKLADRFGIELKYGGGPAEFRGVLDGISNALAQFEELEPMGAQFDDQLNVRFKALRTNLETAMLEFAAVRIAK